MSHSFHGRTGITVGTYCGPERVDGDRTRVQITTVNGFCTLSLVQARELRDMLLALPCLYTPLSATSPNYTGDTDDLPELGKPGLMILRKFNHPLEGWRHKDKPELMCSPMGAMYTLDQVEGWFAYPEVLR